MVPTAEAGLKPATYSMQGCICQIFTGGQSFDWRLATIAGMEVAKLVLWNSLLN